MAAKLSDTGRVFRGYLKATLPRDSALLAWDMAGAMGYLTSDCEPEDYAEVIELVTEEYPHDLFDYFSE